FSTIGPYLSLLPPSSEQLSGGSATLACLLSGYSPQGAMVSWEVDGAEMKEGVLTTTEEEKGGHYCRSSTLTLSKARWEEGEVYTCWVAQDDTSDSAVFRRSPCSDKSHFRVLESPHMVLVLETVFKISMGVPQGSILGPTLFSVYINDVALAAGDSLIHLYADDTILYTFGPSLDTVLSNLQTSFNAIQHSFRGLQLLLNASKTKCMLFNRSLPAPACPTTGPSVRPTVSLLPPSSEQLSGGSATLACLLSGYSPQGAMVSWEVDGAEVKEGIQTTTEEEKGGRYSRSSTLTLSKARWEEGEVYTCRVAHDDTSDAAAFRKSHLNSISSAVC
uniref:Ig-like domain-containing protein n=1 Tax=Oncorhynchus kisutch TaxID=8019 RepID=A0A8C7N4F9_ONCKI